MNAILHVDKNWGIGKANSLMFRLPRDMAYFKDKTLGKVVVMGANTFRSLPKQQPLADRINVVLSIDPMEVPEGVVLVRNMRQLFMTLDDFHVDPGAIWVIGGASLYRSLFPYCREIYVTKVDADGEADTFVPNLDQDPQYKLVSESEPKEDNGYTIRFCVYKNIKAGV